MKRPFIQVRARVKCPGCGCTHESLVDVSPDRISRALADARARGDDLTTVPWPTRTPEEIRQAAERRLAEERMAREAESHVYVIRNPRSNQVKIGRSVNVGQRLQGLRRESGEPLELHGIVGVGSMFERELHVRFAAARVLGEWFDAAHPDIAPWLASLGGQAVIG